MQAEMKYDNARRYYLTIRECDFEERAIPDILINRYRKKGLIECQTLDLVKLNQKIENAHQEVVLMSDKSVSQLLDDVRDQIQALFRACESIALLDMIAAFGQLVTTNDYIRPELTDALVIKSGRHPIREKVRNTTSAAISTDYFT
jgi:DNA mismatch repair protein MSH4